MELMLRSFRIFCDLVETQSFTQAAHRNYLTQSAASRHLQALEEKFGARLIDRGRGRFRLTPAGTLVYRSGQRLQEEYRHLETALRQPVKDEVAGVLRVAAIYTVGLYELPPLTATFLAHFPHVNLQLSYLKAPEIYDAVLNGRFDVGLVDYPRPHPQLRARLVHCERLVVIIPPGHTWATRSRIGLSQLDGQSLIAGPAELPMRRAIDTQLKRAHVRVIIRHTFDNVEVVKQAVRAGLGIAIVPEVAIASEVAAGLLHKVTLSSGTLDRPIGAITRRRGARSPATRKFLALLSRLGNSR